MAFSSRFLRIPKPKKFLYALSLPTGASLIALSLLVNKLSGVYGILAILTGFHLSPFQLSMYIYSICALALTVYLTPYIKTSTSANASPVHCLALAWFYLLDSLVNAAYTCAFAVTWFLVLFQHHAGQTPNKGLGAGTVGDTAGFIDPEHNVSAVEIIASPQTSAVGLGSGQDAIAAGIPSSQAAGKGTGDVVWGRESINSVSIIVAMWTIRAYFVLVMLSWARVVLRQYIAMRAANNPTIDFSAASQDKTLAENPFAPGKPDGAGWKGKLGRLMISIGKSYWLGGTQEEEAWMAGLGARIGQHSQHRRSLAGVGGATQTSQGVALGKINSERESRRRSGTGPPLPSVQAAAGVIDEGDHRPKDESGKMLSVPRE